MWREILTFGSVRFNFILGYDKYYVRDTDDEGGRGCEDTS